jgi:hypothetical protein
MLYGGVLSLPQEQGEMMMLYGGVLSLPQEQGEIMGVIYESTPPYNIIISTCSCGNESTPPYNIIISLCSCGNESTPPYVTFNLYK